MTSHGLPLAAGLGDVFGTVFGIVLGLCGLALFLLGVIAIGERAYRSGAVSALVGAGCCAVALWLVGAFA